MNFPLPYPLPFDPDHFDVFHLGISGGKDSTALFLWYIYESGLPLSKLIATICDTGNEDDFTYRFVEMLSRIHPIRVIQPERDFWELAEWKQRFPSGQARFCTQWLKVIPSREFVLDLMRQGKEVLLMNGVRRGESTDRANTPEYNFDLGYGTSVYRPLVTWEIDHIWEIHKRYLNLQDVVGIVESDLDLSDELKGEIITRIQGHSIPRNPLYDMGAHRVGCFPCMDSDKLAIRGMAKYRPRRIDFIRGKEQTIGKRGYSTFFVPAKVPPGYRREFTTTKGKTHQIATIDDVVEWSQTAYGGKQYDFDPEIINPGQFMVCGLNGECE